MIIMVEKQKETRKIHIYIAVGIILVISVSLIRGFEKSAIESFYHIINDFTADLLVHLYIAGIIILIFGAIKLVNRNKKSK
mgnify:CR=1 FL=1